MYQIYDDKGNVSIKYELKEQAIQAYDNWKDSYISDEVDHDSYVELVYHDSISEDGIIIRKATIIEDDEKYNELGLPSEQGYDWTFWAKWYEYSIAEVLNLADDKYTI